MCGKLIVLAGPLCGEAFPLDGVSVTIGRDSATELSIPDRLISRRHCEVQTVNGGFVLRDLGSSNGTFVNGIPMRERSLEHGDRIRVGESVLLFLDRQAGSHVDSDGEALTEGAVNDRAPRPPRAESIRDTRFEPDSPGAIIAGRLRTDLQGGAIGVHGPRLWRDGDGQGAGGAGDSSEQPAGAAPIRGGQLRRAD